MINTPERVTETSLPTWTVTLTPSPTGISETPIATATPALNTPVSTARPRPGGSGNLSVVSLLGFSLVVLSFAIGFLSLLLFQKSKLAFRTPNFLLSNPLPGHKNTISINRWLLLFLWFGMILFVGYLVVVWVPQFIIGPPRPIAISVMSPLFFDDSLTATPFQPRHPTPVYSSELESKLSPTFDFQGINFRSRADWFRISIDPPSPSVNQGNPINLTFLPSETCDFGDQQACVSSHSLGQQNLVFLTIHSGFGGEGQAFRHAVEGTGINKAAFSLAKVDANLNSLQGAQVSITANGDETGGFAVRGVMRIPAAQVDAYFDLPIAEALKLAASLNPDILSTIDQSQPLLIFETCGWKIPTEPGADSVSNTTGSVYIVVIQPAP